MARSAEERVPWPRLAVLALALGGSASILAAAFAFWRDERRLETTFTRYATAQVASLDLHLSEQVNRLDGVQALWHSSVSVTHDEFREFARSVFAHAAGIEILGWAPRVPREQRADFERQIQDEIGLPFALVEAAREELVPAAGRALSYPLTYREPQQASAPPLGFDLASIPEIAALLERAARSSATGWQAAPVRQRVLGAAADFVAVRPVFERSRVAEEHGRSSATLRGFVLGTFQLEPIFDRALTDMTPEFVQVSVEDTTAAAGLGARYSFPKDLAARRLPASPFALTERPQYVGELAPHTLGWRVVCTAGTRYVADRRSAVPWIVLVAGLALSSMLAWYIRSMEYRTRSLTKANAELYTEIADRHAVENELRETQRARETLLANLPGLAYRCRNDPDWSMTFISDGVIPLTGYTPADFLTNKVSFGHRVIHADDRERVWREVQEALDRHRPFKTEYRIVTAYGDERRVFEQGRGVYSRAGELLALEGLITDVTDRAHAEENLRREKAFADAIIESLPGTFYVFDDQGRFVRWNKNLESISGYTAAELARMHPLDFFASEDRALVARAIQEVFERGHAAVEAPMLLKDGSKLPYYFTGVRFGHENVRFLVGMGLDVSERNLARAERARLQASLLPAQKLESLGVLSGAIAHDFNNLLTVVLGNAGLAKRNLAPGSAAHDFIEEVIGASRSASHLTRQLLDYADIDGRKRTQLDVSAEIAAFAELLRSSIPRTVTLELALADDLPRIEADPAQMQQLVMNLVLNAAESYGEGTGSVRVETGTMQVETLPVPATAIRGEPRVGPCVFVSVRDRGCGLDAEALERMGEPFFTTKFAGRGLGLTAVIGVLRAHGGWLGVDTAPGRGSLFTAYLPLDVASAQPTPPESGTRRAGRADCQAGGKA